MSYYRARDEPDETAIRKANFNAVEELPPNEERITRSVFHMRDDLTPSEARGRYRSEGVFP